MPNIQVSVWKGFGEKNAKKVIKGITEVFTNMGIPGHAVEVIINEIPKTHWGVGGEPASEKLKDVGPPE